MGTVHQLLLEFGREQALKADIDRAVVDTAAAYLASEDTDIGYLYSGWAQAALPHKRLADDALWQVKNDRVTLVVQPGVRVVEDGPPVHVGVPYGSRARLILLYLQSEALRTGSREIELGRSLHAWLRRLSIPIGGKSMRDVRDQADRISRCRMSFQIMQGGRAGLVNQLILDTAMFVDDGEKKGSMFIETATLSQTFYEQLKKHPVPIEEAAVKRIANNSMALDVYCWLAYRLHALTTPTPVSWRALYAQFGQGYGRIDNFRRKFREILGLALAVYPAAQVEEEGRGLLLKPSRPPVSGRNGRLTLVASRSLPKR
jgi:Plasmid encoded RepA protein